MRLPPFPRILSVALLGASLCAHAAEPIKIIEREEAPAVKEALAAAKGQGCALATARRIESDPKYLTAPETPAAFAVPLECAKRAMVILSAQSGGKVFMSELLSETIHTINFDDGLIYGMGQRAGESVTFNYERKAFEKAAQKP